MQRGNRPLSGIQSFSQLVQETRNLPPGTGILIDTQAALNNEENVYYILINGWRVYGKTKEDVVTQLRNLSDDEKNMIKTSSKVSSTIAQKTTIGKSPSFLNRVKGAASNAWGATKRTAGAAGRGLSSAAGYAGRGLSSAASATGRAAGAAGRGLSSAASYAGQKLTAAKQKLTEAMTKKQKAADTPDRDDNARANTAVQEAQEEVKKAERDAALQKHQNSTKNMTAENVNKRINTMFGGTRKKKSTTRK